MNKGDTQNDFGMQQAQTNSKHETQQKKTRGSIASASIRKLSYLKTNDRSSK